MNIITGYRGSPHLTSQQDRNRNIGIFGATPRIIKGVGSEMTATIVSATEIQIADGMVVCQGCMAEIAAGISESMTIDNGEQGMARTDLIVIRYSKNLGSGVEDMQLAVIKGTAAASNPQTPAYNTGTIANGDTLVDFPLYQVDISGISITGITLLMDKTSVVNWINTVLDKIGYSTMGTSATSVTGAIRELVNKIGAVAMGTTATTVTGAIKEHENDISALQGIVNSQMFKTVVKIWDNVTIGADWYWTIVPSIALSGYRPIGIIGFTVYAASSGGVNQNWCIFQRCYITPQDKLDMYVWNQNKNASAKVQVAVRVLYIKTGLVS